MRYSKTIIVFFLLVAFIGGKAHTLLHIQKDKKDNSYSVQKYTLKKIAQDSDDDAHHKRKSKKRFMQVAVPHISDIIFERRYVHRLYEPAWSDNTYSSFLFCVDRKRGPPSY